MNRSYQVTFRSIPAGAEFTCNGNRCRKTSSRTAELIEYGRRFYFGMNEWCDVSKAIHDAVLNGRLY